MTQSSKRRIFRCSECERPFSETRDTVFFDLRTPEDKVMMALKMLLVKVGLSDIGFVLGVTEDTVLEWLRRAAQKAHEINAHLLRDLPVTQVQLDEMWSFIRPTVYLDVIALVTSSYGYNRGEIEPRVAHSFTAHVATQRELAERPQHRHPPRAQPGAPMR